MDMPALSFAACSSSSICAVATPCSTLIRFTSSSCCARIALWHIDTEGAEVDVLASAARLFEAQRIDRIVFEVSPQHWSARHNLSLADGFDALASRLSTWQCEWACTRTRIGPGLPGLRDRVPGWEKAGWEATRQSISKLLAKGARATGTCKRPWDLQSQAVDIYCVRPGVEPIWTAKLDLEWRHARGIRLPAGASQFQ